MTNKHLETFTDANFEREVLMSDLPVLVEFGGEWCRPCRILEPILDKVAVDYAGALRVGISDADTNGEIATRYEIVSLPTLLVFRAGRVVARVIGAVPRKKLDGVLAPVL